MLIHWHERSDWRHLILTSTHLRRQENSSVHNYEVQKTSGETVLNPTGENPLI